MANLIDDPAYVWTENDVYQIDAGDYVEGAVSGASFSGLGVDNHPHQQLANRTRWLRDRLALNDNRDDAQDINITNLAWIVERLQGAILTNTTPGDGYIRIPFGAVLNGDPGNDLLVQWGHKPWSDPNPSNDTLVQVQWPTYFDVRPLWAIAQTYRNDATPSNSGDCVPQWIPSQSSRTDGMFVMNLWTSGSISAPPGINFLAIGY